ncbi:MAG: urea ABC transporter ATP-binding subunit UrtE [Paracoccaceae bacterium]
MLTIKDLKAGYGSAQILNGVELAVQPKEVVALLGRNGVGKTTLMKALMGIVPPMGGQVTFLGAETTALPTHRIARAGIGYVPQGRGIFDKLTVEENLAMGLRSLPEPSNVIPAYLLERFPILHERRRQVAGTLSGGQKQQLAISRALCGNPKLLLLDEPSEGIQPNIVQDIGSFLRELVATREIAVIVVEQNLNLVERAADRFCMMDKGRIVRGGPTADLKDEAVLKEFLSV